MNEVWRLGNCPYGAVRGNSKQDRKWQYQTYGRRKYKAFVQWGIVQVSTQNMSSHKSTLSATWLKDQFSQTVARTKLVPCIGGSECWELGLQRDSRKLLQQVRFLFPSQVSVFLLENNEDSVSQWGNPMIWRRQVEPNPGCGSKFQYKIHYFGQG